MSRTDQRWHQYSLHGKEAILNRSIPADAMLRREGVPIGEKCCCQGLDHCNRSCRFCGVFCVVAVGHGVGVSTAIFDHCLMRWALSSVPRRVPTRFLREGHRISPPAERSAIVSTRQTRDGKRRFKRRCVGQLGLRNAIMVCSPWRPQPFCPFISFPYRAIALSDATQALSLALDCS